MDLWYPLLFISALLIFFYKYFNSNHSYWQKRGVHYVRPLPFVGNLKDFAMNKCHISEVLQNIYKKSKGEAYVGIYVLNSPVLLLRCPKIIKDVMQKDFNYFDNRTTTPPENDKILCSMIFIAKNPTWKTIRQKLTPSYTSGKLKAMFPLIEEVAETMTEYLKRNLPCENMDSRDLAKKYANEVISRTAFGIHAGCFEDENCDFLKWSRVTDKPKFLSQMMVFFAPTLVKYFKPDFMDRNARNYFSTSFHQIIKVREETGTKGNDLVDTLVSLKKNDTTGFWEEDVLLAQAFQIFFAGTETTASAISYTLHELAFQKDIQNKLRSEIKNMIEENGGKIEYEQLLNLKYLDMCVCETNRKYVALAFLDRECNADYKIESTGLVLEKGTKVYVSLNGLHYDEQYFPNPEKYDPQRFEDMSKINQDGLYYIPFGEGPRICIGERFGLMSVKLALAYILSNFEVEPSSKTIPKPSLIKKLIFPRPEELPLKFKLLS